MRERVHKHTVELVICYLQRSTKSAQAGHLGTSSASISSRSRVRHTAGPTAGTSQEWAHEQCALTEEVGSPCLPAYSRLQLPCMCPQLCSLRGIPCPPGQSRRDRSSLVHHWAHRLCSPAPVGGEGERRGGSDQSCTMPQRQQLQEGRPAYLRAMPREVKHQRVAWHAARYQPLHLHHTRGALVLLPHRLHHCCCFL